MEVMVSSRSSNNEDVHEHLNRELAETIILGEHNEKSSTITSASTIASTSIHECLDLKASSEHDSSATMETENSSMGTNAKQPLVRISQEEPGLIGYVSLCKDLEPSQRKALWWSLNDHEVFTETAKSISKELRRHHTLTAGIDEAYRQAGKVASELQEEQDVFDAMKRLTVDSGLAHWCTHGHSRRGLERSGSRVQSIFRLGDAKKMKRTVVELQTTMATGDESMDELLRRESQEHTKTARLFARMMGQADASAATKSHTFMRRWSDLGSTTSTVAGSEQQHYTRYQRTASLPQQTFSNLV